jgi:hypothetical protein
MHIQKVLWSFLLQKIKSSNKMDLLHLPLPDIKIMIAKNKDIALFIIINNYGLLNNKAKQWQKGVQYDKGQLIQKKLTN